MTSNPKRANRIVVYLNDSEYFDALKSADKFDKSAGEYVRFGLLQSMYGSLGMSKRHSNENDSAFEAHEE